MVIPELKLTRKVTVDEEGTTFKLPRIVVEKPREVERGRFYVLSTDIRRRENRQDSESESERLSWREKPGGKNTRTESLRESESERIDKLK